MEIGGVACRVEVGGAGGGFRGGNGGDLVDDGSCALLILANGLWDG